MAIYQLKRGAAGLPFTNFYDADSGILKESPKFFPKGGQAVFRIKGEENLVTTDPATKGAVFGGVQILNDVCIDKHQGDCIAYMKRGQIWVEAGEDVQAGDAVKYDATTGKFGKTGATEVPGGIFKTNGTAGDVAVIEFDAIGA